MVTDDEAIALLIHLVPEIPRQGLPSYQEYLCGGSQLIGSLTTFELNHSEVNAAARRPDRKQHRQGCYHVSP